MEINEINMERHLIRLSALIKKKDKTGYAFVRKYCNQLYCIEMKQQNDYFLAKTKNDSCYYFVLFFRIQIANHVYSGNLSRKYVLIFAWLKYLT